jgi:hypothetical protein
MDAKRFLTTIVFISTPVSINIGTTPMAGNIFKTAAIILDYMNIIAAHVGNNGVVF